MENCLNPSNICLLYTSIAGYQAAARQGALEAYQNTFSAQNSYNLAVAQLEPVSYTHLHRLYGKEEEQ